MFFKTLLIAVATAALVWRADAEPCFAEGKSATCQGGTQPCSGGVLYPDYCGGTKTCCVPSGPPGCNYDPPASQTAEVEITALSGYFSDTVAGLLEACGGSNGQSTACSEAQWRSQIRWGLNAAGQSGFASKSGLGFTTIAPRQVDLATTFKLGTFFHYNFPVYNNVTLPDKSKLNIELNIAGTVVKFTYDMLIAETPNIDRNDPMGQVCPYFPEGLTPAELDSVEWCPDRISLLSNGFTQQKFSVPGQNTEYTLELVGFKQDVCQSETQQFWITQERVINEATLIGRVTQACPSTCPAGDSLIFRDGACVCSSAAPTTTEVTTSTVPGLIVAPKDNTGNVVGIAVGVVAGLCGIFLLAFIGFLSYNKVTTGSWLGKKKKADVAIAVNPLYQDNANAGSNPLFEGE